nr:CMRF35-like molecule 7 isoform X2 [Pan paniscus]
MSKKVKGGLDTQKVQARAQAELPECIWDLHLPLVADQADEEPGRQSHVAAPRSAPSQPLRLFLHPRPRVRESPRAGVRAGAMSCILGFCFPGCFSIQGPESVRAPEQGSLTVQCHYKQGWETYIKWWCRGARWDTCKILIETRGSEQGEKSDRVSIKDNQKDRTFTVTMEGLRRDDADVYWCGIERRGPDLGTRVKVIVDPGTTTCSWYL